MQQSVPQNFKYLIDEFADAKIIRYKVNGWENLSLKQKEYIFHLSEAGKWGRDIMFDQNFKYNIKIRKVLEAICSVLGSAEESSAAGATEAAEAEKLLAYAKRVFFSSGIHHHYSGEKFVPECSQEFFAAKMAEAGVGEQAEFLLPIIFDPELYKDKKNVVNFYDGVTPEEAEAFYAKMANASDPRPISYGLNSKLVKDAGTGSVVEEVYKVGGLYGPFLEKIISHLEKAKIVAENNRQVECIDLLIDYYRSGDLKTWDEYNVAWVQDTESVVDFVNGFVETYDDPKGMKATWEAVINFKDEEASKRTQTISDNAQWFEDHSPVDDSFKKKEVKGVSAKVINVACLGGACYPTAPIGINLPNSDWIRKDYGSKSVTIANLTDAYDKAAEESPKSMSKEFSYDEEEVALLKKYGSLTSNLHTDLHECLGHGSGQLLPGVPSNALKDVSSSLEEARADLFALYYMPDQKLLDLGLLPNAEAYKAEYISYIRNGLFTQYVRIDLGKDVVQAHMQGRKLISEWAYKKGLNDGVIEKVERECKTYFVIKDYARLRALFGELLAEIQRIKSEGDYPAGKKLIEDYGTVIDPLLHKEVKARYAALNLKPYGGFINPEIVAVYGLEEDLAGDLASDFRLEYPDDYLQQMLEYGNKYTLK